MARRGSYSWALAAYGKPCNRRNMTDILIQPGIVIWADARTADVWRAMGKLMLEYGYQLRPGDTGAYNCRPTTGGSTPSRHAHGLACDCNWQTNPYIKTPTRRTIRWGVETDMPAQMVRAIESITAGGVEALEWGGRWRSVKDAMHFQILVTPAEIAAGVKMPGGGMITPEEDEMTLKRGDKGNTVGLYQQAVGNWATLNSIALPPDADLTVDEVFGAGFELAVKVYQAAADLTQTGQLDGVTCANLSRYVPLAVTPAGDHEHPHSHQATTTIGDPT